MADLRRPRAGSPRWWVPAVGLAIIIVSSMASVGPFGEPPATSPAAIRGLAHFGPKLGPGGRSESSTAAGQTPRDRASISRSAYVSGNSTTDRVEIGTIPSVGAGPRGIGFDPVNDEVFVAGTVRFTYAMPYGTLTTINGSSHKVLGNLRSGSYFLPAGVVYDPANENMYVTDSGSGGIEVFNGSTDNLVTTIFIPCGTSASLLYEVTVQEIAYDPLNGYLFATDYCFVEANSTSFYASYNLTIINGTSNRVVSSIPVGYEADGVAVDTTNGTYFRDQHRRK